MREDVDEEISRRDDAVSPASKQQVEYTYNPKKPKWWKNVSGNATKGQKKAMNLILANHRLPPVPYGQFIDFSTIFPEMNDIWFEIGFGTGDNLLALAHRKRKENISLVGAEIHKAGIGTACRRMQNGIESNTLWSDYVSFSRDDNDDDDDDDEPDNDDNDDDKNTTSRNRAVEDTDTIYQDPYKNVRLYTGDAIKLFPYIPSSSLSTILITFPDPFPKDQQAQWRVIQINTILELYRTLKVSGRFFLATDHEGFNEWSHSVMDAANDTEKILFRKIDPCPDRSEWLPAISKYEQKGWDEGRQTRLSCWVKVSKEDNE